MSKANGQIKKEDTYLQHVSLKNYKSIKHVEIDFKPGLNIIIGKNASGKTNFIDGLNKILRFEDAPFSDSENKLIVCFGGDKIEIQVINKSETKLDLLSNEYSDFPLSQEVLLKINEDRIKGNNYDDLRNHLIEKDFFFNQIKIKYGIHYKDTARFINIPFSFVLINNDKVSRELMMVTLDDNRTEFIQQYFHHLYIQILGFYYRKDSVPSIKNDSQSKDLKDVILSFSGLYFRNTNEFLFKYSPIQAIRLNPDFNIIKESDGQKQTVTNFYLEFLIDRTWLTFNLLSDGTKRLFYLISEMTATDYLKDIFLSNNNLNVLLVEEPELGIHPHQLHQLMQFIKEQSREKQIIITTHSPQVLDILESDELDRVIICHYDSNKGTQLSHLSDKEIKKAKKYMQEEAFLSDYWRFSDLEPAS